MVEITQRYFEIEGDYLSDNGNSVVVQKLTSEELSVAPPKSLLRDAVTNPGLIALSFGFLGTFAGTMFDAHQSGTSFSQEWHKSPPSPTFTDSLLLSWTIGLAAVLAFPKVRKVVRHWTSNPG